MQTHVCSVLHLDNDLSFFFAYAPTLSGIMHTRWQKVEQTVLHTKHFDVFERFMFGSVTDEM